MSSATAKRSAERASRLGAGAEGAGAGSADEFRHGRKVGRAGFPLKQGAEAKRADDVEGAEAKHSGPMTVQAICPSRRVAEFAKQ